LRQISVTDGSKPPTRRPECLRAELQQAQERIFALEAPREPTPSEVTTRSPTDGLAVETAQGIGTEQTPLVAALAARVARVESRSLIVEHACSTGVWLDGRLLGSHAARGRPQVSQYGAHELRLVC
jgi:hypothetical protein